MKTKIRKNAVLYLVIAVPVASVLMGSATLYFALSGSDAAIRDVQPPLSKTSWRDEP